MGILRSIESRLERVVEGSVGRLFRASVAPVELARKLAKELEEGKVVSVTQTYAPNEYTIYLSPRDRTRFAEFEASLRNELASYLAEHARRAGYVMPTRPRVRFETESSLHTGIFGISTALVRDDDAPLEAPLDAPVEAPPAEPQVPGIVPETVFAPPPLAGIVPEMVIEPPPAPVPAPPPVAEPEGPLGSPLDPDPSKTVPPLGFPAFPLEPAPEPEPEPPPFVPPLPYVPPLPDVLPVQEAEPAPPSDPLPQYGIPTPPLPVPPVHEAIPTPPPLPPLPPMPEPPPLAPLPPDEPPAHEAVPEPPVVPPPPPPLPPPTVIAVPPPLPMPEPPPRIHVPDEPPQEATMITRTGPREELALLHNGQRTVIEGPVLQIGRAPGCDIVLDDKNVSRRHAEIRRRGPVVVLVDLDSTNGTIVNGRRVREHPLVDGDRISLGESRLTFERRTI